MKGGALAARSSAAAGNPAERLKGGIGQSLFALLLVFLLLSPFFPVFAVSSVPLSVHSSSAGAESPNIIVINADDLGWGDLGCYGHPKFKTPRIDRLATEGARLTQFYSPAPNCSPSRVSLLTGRYQFHAGITRVLTPADTVGIADSEITLAEGLKGAGYATACIGKWHLGHLPQFRPTRHGFDEYLGILYSNDMRPVELMKGDERIEYPVEQTTLTRRYTDVAVDFIQRNRDRRFFLYLPHAMPHKPLAASPEFYKKSGAGLYGDVLAELDWNVGRLLDRLRELGLERKTLVIFTSDNGAWYGGSTGGLRGMKGRTWEGGIRVPFIARWPGRIPPGVTRNQPAVMPDIFATCLAAAEVPSPTDRTIDGKNLLPVLMENKPGPHEAIFSFHAGEIRTVRSGKWKLHVASPGPAREKIWSPDEPWVDPNSPDGTTILGPKEQYHPSQFPGITTGDEWNGVALFDLEADPTEQRDVSSKNPDVVKRLREFVDKMKATIPPAG